MLITTNIKKLARLIEKQAATALKYTDISVGYTNYLMCLYQKDGISQTALQQEVGVEHPTVVRALDRMARDGFIERRANPNDRRSFLVYLTDKARRNQKDVIHAAEELNRDLLTGLTSKEHAEIEHYMECMISNLSKTLK